MTVDYRFLLRLFLRRIHVLLLVALPVTAAAVWLAVTMPPRFDAGAQLLVEAPQVPDSLAASTLQESPFEVLGAIRQRILARDNMLDMSREFGLHADRSGFSPDDIVADMRRRITISIPRGGRGMNTGTVSVAFESGRAEVAASVANSLVDQILRENIALRTASVTQTLVFFDEELQRLDEELARQTSRILEFREANQDALPESLTYRRTRQTTLQERLLQVQREMTSLNERRDRMVAMYERTGRVEGASAANRTDEERELNELRRELSRANLVFAPENPRLRTLRRQVEALEAVVADQMGADTEEGGEVSLFDLQVSDIDVQIDFLAAQREAIEDEMSSIAASIDATAANAAQLSSLERDYENLQSQYNNAVSRRAQARIGERLEAQSRGHRITILEQATPPNSPNRPNRRAIAMAGLGGGLGLGTLVVVLLILSNRAVLRPVELTTRLGAPPFGTVPLFRTRRQVLARRAVLAGLALVLLAGAPAGLWWLDTNVMPLDLLVARLGDMTGLGGLRTMMGDGGA